jgi:hypothetical protein
MACLKNRAYPNENKKTSKLEKFKSFQILEPIGRIGSIKQLSEVQSKNRMTVVRSPKLIPARNVRTRSTISDRIQRI